jgi:nucleoside recognition membrane protein YjiH
VVVAEEVMVPAAATGGVHTVLLVASYMELGGLALTVAEQADQQ